MLKRYLENTSGHFGLLFGLTAGILLMGVGAAIDVTGITKQKSELQQLSDAAVLAGATLDQKNKKKVKKAIKAFVLENNMTGVKLKPIITFENDHIQVTLEGEYNTVLMGMFGKSKLPVSALSEAPQKQEIPINLALVLDTTGSMNGANMTSLKSASEKLLDVFTDADSTIKVGVVPFSNYVNVGLENRNKNWMDVPADSSVVTPPGACYMWQPTVCVGGTTTTTTTKYNDGVPYESTSTSCAGTWEPDGPELEYCPTETITNTTWNGCVGSRDNDRHKKHAYKGKKFPGIMNVSCADPILEITQDLDAVKAKIQGLSASQNTYIPAGLAWGWRLLEANNPYGDLTKKEAKLQRAMVLMTDGKNTLSLNQPMHNGNDEAAANVLTSELCELIKNENIQLYTVAYKFDGGDATAKSIVKNCATSSSMFFDAQNTADLEKAFENIGQSLFSVRLSR